MTSNLQLTLLPKDAPQSVKDIRNAAKDIAQAIEDDGNLPAYAGHIVAFEAGVQYVLAKFLAIQNAGGVVHVKDTDAN